MMSAQTDKPAPRRGLLPFLFSICFVGAVIVVIFGAASLLSLDPGREIVARSGPGSSGEAKSILPDQGSPSDVAAAPDPVKTDAASVDATPPPVQEPAPPATPAPETAGPQPAVEPVSSSEQPPQAKPDASPSAADTAMSPPDAQTDRSAHEEQIPPEPEAIAGTGISAVPENIPARSTPSSQSRGHALGTKTAARQSRLKRECGPIRDPALHRHCVASFTTDHPIR